MARYPATQRSPGPYGTGAVANSSNDGGGDNWSDPRDLTYPRASGIRGRDPFQFQVELFDLLFNELPHIPEHVDQASHLRRQVRLGVLQNVRHGSLEIRRPVRKKPSRARAEIPEAD